MTILLALVHAEGSSSLGLGGLPRQVWLNKHPGTTSSSAMVNKCCSYSDESRIPGSTPGIKYRTFLLKTKVCDLQSEAGFWVLLEMTVKRTFFWIVAPCSLVTALNFGETNLLHLQDRRKMKQEVVGKFAVCLW